MTYEEYFREARESLLFYQLTEKYVKRILEGEYIRASYIQEVKVTEILGENQLSPSGFGFGCHMMYPDDPYTDEQLRRILNEDDSAFLTFE